MGEHLQGYPETSTYHMNEPDHLHYAQEQCTEADRLIVDARERESEITTSTPQLIRDCQEAVEISVKAMYFALDLEPPEKEHGISFDNAHPLLTAEFPENFYREDDIPRAIFLTQFWKEFYTLAKYGDEVRDVPPTQIFSDDDLEIAINHAAFCQNLCQTLIDSVRADLSS